MCDYRTVSLTSLSKSLSQMLTYASSGLYIPNDDRWPEHFRGIGIRIEDSVCVQEEGPLVLTTEAVKEVIDLLLD